MELNSTVLYIGPIEEHFESLESELLKKNIIIVSADQLESTVEIIKKKIPSLIIIDVNVDPQALDVYFEEIRDKVNGITTLFLLNQSQCGALTLDLLDTAWDYMIKPGCNYLMLLHRILKNLDLFSLDRYKQKYSSKKEQEQIAQKYHYERQEREINLLKLNEKRYESLLKLSYMLDDSVNEIMNYALETGMTLSASEAGVIYIYDHINKKFTEFAWKKNNQETQIRSRFNEPIVLDNAGLLKDVILEGKPFIVNKYEEGSVPYFYFPIEKISVRRFLLIPSFLNGKIEAVIGVFNKDYNYNKHDVKQINSLMDVVWKLKQRKELNETIRNLNSDLEVEVEKRTEELEVALRALQDREEALRESEERFRLLMEQSPVPITIYDKKGNLNQFNSSWTQLFGYEEDAGVLGQYNILKDKGMIQAGLDLAFYSALESRITDISESVFTSSFLNGRVIYLHSHVYPLKGANGIIKNVVIIYEDITERKLAEMKQEESDRRFRLLFNQVFDSLLIFDNDLKITNINESACVLLEYSKEELLALELSGILADGELETVEKGFIEGKKKKFIGEIVVVSKNNKRIPTEAGWAYMDFEDKQYIIGSFRDTSARRMAEEKLKESEERFKLFMKHLPASASILSTSEELMFGNEMYFHMIDGNPEEVIGKKYSEYLPEDTSRYLQMQDAKVIEENKAFEFLEHNEVDGEEFYFRATKFPIYKQDKIIAIGGITFDVSEQKRSEKGLKKAKEEAEIANRAKSQFLANMSHEIRTPLNAVIGFSELLITIVKDEKQQSYLNSIKVAGKSLLTLINDILDLSKIEAGMMKIQYTSVEFKEIFYEIEQIFTPRILEKGIEFILDLSEDMPAALMLDEIRLRQVLLNLVGNAIKFTNRGFVKVSAGVLNRREDTVDIFIDIKDTGIGIPEMELEKIFESFHQQTRQSRKQYEGTGLGLSISKKLVELMNGRILVESMIDEGSVFKILLSDVKISDIESTAEDNFLENIRTLTFNNETVMIIDDIDSNRLFLKELLQSVHLNVSEAENGRVALAKINEAKPDLIFMDIRMPVLDGISTTKILKSQKDNKHIPIIALTASHQKSEIDKLEHAGFSGYLLKPLNLSTLFHIVCKYITPGTIIASEKSLLDIDAGEKIDDLSGLIGTLEKDIIPEVEALSGVINHGKVKKFARNLKEIAEAYKAVPVLSYVEELSKCVDAFDIKNINKVLNQFNELILVLKSMEEKNGSI